MDYAKKTADRMRNSSVVVLLVCNPDKLDLKVTSEIGVAVMLGKPIIALIRRGTIVSEKLASVIDRFIECDLENPSSYCQAVMEAILDLEMGNASEA